MAWRNGYIPESDLVVFRRGSNATDGDWFWGLTPGTYARHLKLVERGKSRTGRVLEPSDGWGTYRPYDAQVIARRIHGNGAAVPGTSSHGGFWEGRETLAIDYGNWAWVYNGDRAAFYADARAVGLTPGMIATSRGYPDEPWHVIDMSPRNLEPGFAGISVTPLEDDMPSVEELMDFNVPRQGDGASGTTNLRQTIAWLDNNLNSLRSLINQLPKLESIINGVYNTPIERKGGGPAGATTLAATLAWLDGNLGKIIEQTGGNVDPEVVRKAVTAALESALAGTSLDPQATAKAVRAEFKADPIR